MNLKRHLPASLVVALSAGPLSLVSAQDNSPAIYLSHGTYEGVPYLSGGVGQEERQYITNSLAGNYNVRLEFAAANGDYLSSVRVRIADESGRTVLAAEAEGPWLFARLDPGEYRVEATAENRTFNNSLTVNEQGTSRLVFKGWHAK